MSLCSPRLEIHPARIQENARAVFAQCRAHGAQVAAVTKVTSAHQAVAQALADAGADQMADSRIANLRSIREQGIAKPRLLLRISTPSQALDVVRNAEMSLNSGLSTLRLLDEAAAFAKLRHSIIVMVDVGDLREGVWPDRAVPLMQEAAKLKNLDILGMGCNLACYGGVIPSVENMQKLIEVRDACRKATGLDLSLLSGGNSANLPLLASGKMPKEINHFRIGEAIVLGRNVIDRSPWPGTRQDTFRLVAEVVELETKPSVPIGETGQDAFGGTPTFVDRGLRKRAILNIGRQDVAVDGIEPLDPGIIVLGGSSDHLLLDVEDAKDEVKVGSEIAFYPGYGALLALSTSPYVQKAVIQGHEHPLR